MAGEVSESSSSGLADRSNSSPMSGHASNIHVRRKTKEKMSMERIAKQRNGARKVVGSQSDRPKADSCKPVFNAEPIDPEIDKAIVIDAVHFVLSASTKGCCSLVSKFAEHLKYKLSLEEKVIFLNRELKKLQKFQPYHSGSGKSSPISLESETCRLTKGLVCNSSEPNIVGQEFNEFVLPGAVLSNNAQTPSKPPKRSPTSTVSKLQDNDVFSYYNASESLPKLSQKDDKPFKKIFADAQIQTADTRKPIMVDEASSTDPQSSSHNMLQEQLINAQALVAQLQHQLVLCENKKSGCTDIGTQTDDKISEEALSWLSRSRSASALSATNTSTKSFPGVIKTKCENCVKERNAKQSRHTPHKYNELAISIGDRVSVKGRGMGTVKFIGKLEGAGCELSVGLYLDKPVGENDGSWHYFHCSSNRGIFVPIQEVKQIKTKKNV